MHHAVCSGGVEAWIIVSATCQSQRRSLQVVFNMTYIVQNGENEMLIKPTVL